MNVDCREDRSTSSSALSAAFACVFYFAYILDVIMIMHRFNRGIDNVEWPRSLKKLTFGCNFNKPVLAAKWPPELEVRQWRWRSCNSVQYGEERGKAVYASLCVWTTTATSTVEDGRSNIISVEFEFQSFG